MLSRTRFRDRWWDRSNIVATDFFLSNDLVGIAKQVGGTTAHIPCQDQSQVTIHTQVNLKRSICTKAGLGYDLSLVRGDKDRGNGERGDKTSSEEDSDSSGDQETLEIDAEVYSGKKLAGICVWMIISWLFFTPWCQRSPLSPYSVKLQGYFFSLS